MTKWKPWYSVTRDWVSEYTGPGPKRQNLPWTGRRHEVQLMRTCNSILSIPRSSVRFRQKPDNSNSHEFELHRPSNKGTKLLLKVIKAIIIIDPDVHWHVCTPRHDPSRPWPCWSWYCERNLFVMKKEAYSFKIILIFEFTFMNNFFVIPCKQHEERNSFTWVTKSTKELWDQSGRSRIFVGEFNYPTEEPHLRRTSYQGTNVRVRASKGDQSLKGIRLTHGCPGMESIQVGDSWLLKGYPYDQHAVSQHRDAAHCANMCCARVCTRAHTNTHTHTHAHTHTHTHTGIHSHTHIHARTHISSGSTGQVL